MKVWNYIGEFFLFRWLFGKLKKSATKHNAQENSEREYLNGYHDEEIAPIDRATTPDEDVFLDDSDDSEELDDLDIFMRNNSGNHNSCQNHRAYDDDYHSSSRYDSLDDWNSGNYSQSFDDFLDE